MQILKEIAGDSPEKRQNMAVFRFFSELCSDKPNKPSMIVLIGIMLLGVAAGLLLRNRRMPWIGTTVTVLVWLLLFLLGLEAGANDAVVRGALSLGWQAIAISLAATIGSAAAAYILWKYIKVKKSKR